MSTTAASTDTTTSQPEGRDLIIKVCPMWVYFEGTAAQLHDRAHNALATALHCLQRPDCTPANLKTATARAVRAATPLKRASAAADQVEG
ncbi:MAG: hypothetical protein Q7V09_20845 [Hydrogenophaga sp.]|uniref:hypothetical protein n=1 Tax=Hydrogenophaga sp. TaxID=1904254 RepID=UPI00271CF4E0|nr:hypothetical protein [Hydrogenophaga sp.]MDO9032883.1 hypothetical protein [Hydrogenophaga sp.]